MLRGLVTYIKESREELKKVIWPTRRSTINHTLVVIGLSVFVGLFLALLDLLFQYILKSVI